MSGTLLRLAVLSCCGVAALAPATARGQFVAGDVPITGASDPAFTALDSQITQHMADNQISAMTVAVMAGGRVVYERGFGWRNYTYGDLTPVEPNNIMRIASVTKPMIAAAVQKLISDGLIAHSDKVFDYGQAAPGTGILPADVYFPWNDTLGDNRLLDITVRNVLRHRGGWDRGMTPDPQFDAVNIADTLGVAYPPGPVNTVKYMLAQPLDYDPGQDSFPAGSCNGTHCYSNFGFMLLALIIEEVTGQDHLDYLQDNFQATWGGTPRELQNGKTFAFDQPTRPSWVPDDRVQDPTEPYYCAGGGWTNVFAPNNGITVEGAYGGWEQEVFIGHGDLVTNTLTMLHFLDRYYFYTDYNSPVIEIGTPLPGVSDTLNGHLGSLPGTNSLAYQYINDQVNIAVIANRRMSGDDSYVTAVEALVVAHMTAPGFALPGRFATDNWVDFSAPLPLPGSIGLFNSPANDLDVILAGVQTNGLIKIKPGSSNWTGTINQAVRIEAPLGTVTIGQ